MQEVKPHALEQSVGRVLNVHCATCTETPIAQTGNIHIAQTGNTTPQQQPGNSSRRLEYHSSSLDIHRADRKFIATGNTHSSRLEIHLADRKHRSSSSRLELDRRHRGNYRNQHSTNLPATPGAIITASIPQPTRPAGKKGTYLSVVTGLTAKSVR